MRRKLNRSLRFEKLESREVFATDYFAGLHNEFLPADVNNDTRVTAIDALMVINQVGRHQRQAGESAAATDCFYDVNNDGLTTPLDALQVLNSMAKAEAELSSPSVGSPVGSPLVAAAANAKAAGVGTTYQASFNSAETANITNLMTASDVQTLLQRASMASSSRDAIIAIVDRTGRILGVRVEDQVSTTLKGDVTKLAFAIDGAVAKARTAAFFSSNEAPLTSRTVRYISQSTITQREVESSPGATDVRYQGPGLVAPIGVGGHFPPQTAFTPQVDLFNIEHQSRDSQFNAGANGINQLSISPNVTNPNRVIVVGGDDFKLQNRFNANGDYIPAIADPFFDTWPESYGIASGTAPNSPSRGIATLPGGVPLYKTVVNSTNQPVTSPRSASINLVGGIGVFFPGETGYATHEQNFIHASQLNGVAQTEASRTSAAKVLESEFIALAAAAANGIVAPSGFSRDVAFVNSKLPALARFVALNGRIDLVGITLEIYGPTPTRNNTNAGIDQVLNVGRQLGTEAPGFIHLDVPVTTTNAKYLSGQAVPQGWLVAPHASTQSGGLTAADVEKIITQGITQANATRAAIRLVVDNDFRPGARTKMVLSVADTNGELLGVFRMNDATIFSIDVSIAKARNTAYYADPADLRPADRIDFNADGAFTPVSTSLGVTGDTVPLGTALTNRTFRFLAEPRYPTGTELPGNAADGLVNDATKTLRNQNPAIAQIVGPESILQMPGINPLTGENLDRLNPLSATVYKDATKATASSYDSFVPTRNFRDPGDTAVVINGTVTVQPLANQNGVVFFPGSTSLYRNSSAQLLVGGFGVSGDGVDQDDVVTAYGQASFDAPQSIRVDSYYVGSVRLPFQKYNRNPNGQ